MQVPPVWLSAFGHELPDAFDPCVNIAVGTAMLSEFDSECGGHIPSKASSKPPRWARATGPSAALRRCVLGKYERAIGFPDFALVTTLELHMQRPSPPAALDAPILVIATAQGSRPDSLLVPTSGSVHPIFPSSP
jgi:hypothetical protein